MTEIGFSQFEFERVFAFFVCMSFEQTVYLCSFVNSALNLSANCEELAYGDYTALVTRYIQTLVTDQRKSQLSHSSRR